jgi:hypothetical protein
MLRLDARTAQCWVFTFKEGLLSPVAHDLKLEVREFSIDVDEMARSVRARFDARTLTVVCAMKEGVESPSTLNVLERATIERTIRGDVLETKRHPFIEFAADQVADDGDAFRVRGQLTLRGATRPLEFRLTPQDGRYMAKVKLHQPDFGIRPYTAFLGTLKIRPDVVVELSLTDVRK